MVQMGKGGLQGDEIHITDHAKREVMEQDYLNKSYFTKRRRER